MEVRIWRMVRPLQVWSRKEFLVLCPWSLVLCPLSLVVSPWSVGLGLWYSEVMVMGDENLLQVETQIIALDLPAAGFVLESGKVLSAVSVAYEAYGDLNDERDNVIFICHALTGDAHVAGYHGEDRRSRGWWDSMVGSGKGIDTDHYHVICANVLGGCKGTTGPSSIDPATGVVYGSSFPQITVRDIVNVHVKLLQQLGMENVASVIGGSFGGMQAFEMALCYPDMVKSCICIASAASLSAQALAFDAISQSAIRSDPNWQGGDYYESGKIPADGLSLARKIGHITYLSSDSMTSKFGREKSGQKPVESEGAGDSHLSDFEVGRYLDYQGEKFVNRFDANSYLHITQALDEYDLVERHGTLESAFEKLKSKVLVVALTSDWLFPPEQSSQIANALLRAGKNVSYSILCAPHGHDGFLVDIENLAGMIRAFLPWVGVDKKSAEIKVAKLVPEKKLSEYERIQKLISPGSSVLDLGCGDGTLLSYLRENGQVRGMGVDIKIENIIDVIYKGHDIFQNDVDGGLEMIPDDMYDYAVLSETLQVVKKPRLVLREMLRVAHEGIVTFPNFGKWSHRLHLCMTGRMPKGKAIPHEWYDTPNIHPFTVSDFVDLCKAEGICIEEMFCISSGVIDKFLNRCGFCNAGSSRVLVRITTKERSKGASGKGCTCD